MAQWQAQPVLHHVFLVQARTLHHALRGQAVGDGAFESGVPVVALLAPIEIIEHETGDFTAIEINPRFGGGYPLSYRANANYPAMIVREYLLGEEPVFFNDWKAGMLMLRYDDEIIVDDYKG